MLLAEQPINQRLVHHGPLVLVTGPRNILRPQQIETELSHDVLNPARVPLSMGEQPNPWDLLQPQDVTTPIIEVPNPPRRYELLGGDQPVIPGVPFIL